MDGDAACAPGIDFPPMPRGAANHSVWHAPRSLSLRYGRVAAGKRSQYPGVAADAVQPGGWKNIPGSPPGILCGTNRFPAYVAGRRVGAFRFRHDDGLPSSSLFDSVRTFFRAVFGDDPRALVAALRPGEG